MTFDALKLKAREFARANPIALGALAVFIVFVALSATGIFEPSTRIARLSKPQAVEVRPVARISVDDLKPLFEEHNYTLDAVRAGQSAVPRLFVTAVPSDLREIAVVREKKRIFLKTVLPLVLEANQKIREDRARLLALGKKSQSGEPLSMSEERWLARLARQYRLKKVDFNLLVRRVDVIPASLALAQAAEESGWGTSRFARQGNALFGQWTTGKAGLVPGKREGGKSHTVRAFRNLYDSVRSYMNNLNSHPAYKALRVARAQSRAQGQPPRGTVLAGYLTAYSARGQDYVRSLRGLIATNRLAALENAPLRDDVNVVVVARKPSPADERDS